MDAVLTYPDFPILLETWRTCLQDEFDLENLKRCSTKSAAGEIKLIRGRHHGGLPLRRRPDLETDQHLHVRGRLAPVGKGLRVKPGTC